MDGIAVGEVRLERTMAFHFTFDETLDLGVDTASPVTDDYPAKDNQFNGFINWVQIDIDQAAADQDHLISPEERFRIAVTRQ